MGAKSFCWILAAMCIVGIVACSPLISPATALPETPVATTVPAQATDEDAMNLAQSELVAAAQAALAERLAIALDQIEVLEVRDVTWPDASLGCPQAGMAYAQTPQQGLLIRLRAGEEMYFYHSGDAQQPFLCENLSLVVPNATPKEDERVPPPDSDVD